MPSPQSATVISPEMQLLCRCVCPNPDSDLVQQLKILLQQDIDWPLLIKLSISHRVAHLLYQNIQAVKPEGLPECSLNQIKNFLYKNASRNLRLTQELLGLLKLLEANGIAAIPFKGPLLSIQAYGDVSTRQFSDLDILVHDRDFLNARHVLLSNGYQRAERKIYGLADVETQELQRLKRFGECSLHHADKDVFVDLHGRLVAGEFPLMSANFDVFWDRLAPVPLHNTTVQTFSPEDLLLYLCIHGAKDLWKRLNWVCDVAALVSKHPHLNWAQLIKRAQTMDSEQMLLLGLVLAREMLLLPLPEIVTQHIQTHFTKQSLVVQIKQRLLSGLHPANDDYSLLQRLSFHGQVIENKSDKLRYYTSFAAHWLFTRLKPNVYDQEFLPLPRQLYFLYYLIRPVRLFISQTNASNNRLDDHTGAVKDIGSRA